MIFGKLAATQNTMNQECTVKGIGIIMMFTIYITFLCPNVFKTLHTLGELQN